MVSQSRLSCLLAVIFCFCFFTVEARGLQGQDSDSNTKSDRIFNFNELEEKRLKEAKSYLPFLNVDSLHCGIYCLAVGAKDGQSPHQQDEIYYVESGVAKINIEGNDYDLRKGSIVFVPAKAEHHFHSIKEDLKTLVFFSKGPVAKTQKESDQARNRRLHHSTESAMSFNATFDSVTDANLFGNHGWICTAESTERKSFKEHAHTQGSAIEKDAGVVGDCLRFTKKTKEVLFYKAKEAADFYPRDDWAGSVSFWLKLDPNQALGNGYCDPVQIAGRKWNDGAIWVDFANVNPRTFRLGVFSDFEVWNPNRIKWEEVPKQDRPIVVVENPPFQSDRWTHVAFTFENINSTKDRDSVAKLYLNGKMMGAIKQPIEISWDEENDPFPAIMLGWNYIGDFDELEIFHRALTEEEIGYLHQKNQQKDPVKAAR